MPGERVAEGTVRVVIDRLSVCVGDDDSLLVKVFSLVVVGVVETEEESCRV